MSKYKFSLRTYFFLAMLPLLAAVLVYYFAIRGRNELKPEIVNTESASRAFEVYDSQEILNPAGSADDAVAEESHSQKILQWGKENVTANDVGELEEKVKNITEEQNIFLPAGEYHLNLEIREKTLRIKGEAGRTILKAQDGGREIIKIENGGLLLADVILSEGVAGINAVNSNLAVSGIKIENTVGAGIFVSNAKVEIVKTEISGCGSGVKATGAGGVISGCRIFANQKEGINLFGGSIFDITGNKITGNGSYGILVAEDSQAEIESNYIQDNQGFNVRIQEKRMIFK